MILLLLAACSPTSGELSVLTYNVKGAPDIEQELRPIEERLPLISPMLAPYDLVGLQEVFDEDQWALVTADAPQAWQEWYDDLLDDRPAPSGLGLLSDVGAFEGYYAEHYTDCYGVLEGSSDCLAAKGFQVLTVDLGLGLLDIYNTHHEAGGGEEDVAARHEQVSQVLAAMDVRSEDRAILFMGDTNLRPSDPEDLPELQRYEGFGLRDACTELGCEEDDHIDRFYLRDGDDLVLTAVDWQREEGFVDAAGDDLSDHPALSLRLVWAR